MLFLEETIEFLRTHKKSETDILYVSSRVKEYHEVIVPNRKRPKNICEERIYTCTWEEFKDIIKNVEYDNNPGYCEFGTSSKSKVCMGINNELFIMSNDGWFIRRTQYNGCNDNHSTWTMYDVPSKSASAGKLEIKHVFVEKKYSTKDTDYHW